MKLVRIMSENRINIGVLGAANIAVRSIIPTIQRLPSLYKLEGIASRSSDKAEAMSNKFNTPAFLGYQSLIEQDGLDAVYIPLPNSLHSEWIDKALDQGLHVLVEKSMACSESEVIALNKKAQSKGLVLVENFQFRFHIQLEVIKKIIQSGQLGELRCMRTSFGFPPFKDSDNIRYQAELGGGALLDAGAYPLKISQIILGNDLSVTAAKWYIDEEQGVDIWGGGFLEQNNGHLFSEIAFGFDHYYQCNIELWGNQGKLFTNRLFTAKPSFEPEIIIETNNGKEIIKVETDNHFENMLCHFHKLVQNPALAEEEYIQNVNQARLIQEFKSLANVQ